MKLASSSSYHNKLSKWWIFQTASLFILSPDKLHQLLTRVFAIDFDNFQLSARPAFSNGTDLGPSYFANFTSALESMHRTRLARSVWGYPFNPAAKYEYSNNTLESSACISGQGGKSQDLYGKGHEFKPALGISIWTTCSDGPGFDHSCWLGFDHWRNWTQDWTGFRLQKLSLSFSLFLSLSLSFSFSQNYLTTSP